MPLKDVLKKRSQLQGEGGSTRSTSSNSLNSLPNPVPEFTFMRTTTHEQEVIVPPSYPGDDEPKPEQQLPAERRRRNIFRKSSANVLPTTSSLGTHVEELPVRPKNERKLSERLHFGRSRGLSRSESSSHLPDDLGDAPKNTPAPLDPPDAKGKIKEMETKENKLQREAQWEKRATMMALKNPLLDGEKAGAGASKGHRRTGSLEEGEDDIQEAIRLHEAGDLERSTIIFGRLADPNGANNPLSQVLYGLALR